MAAKRRLLFYVHDRIGIGHLKKVTKLASYLEDEFACAIVCGHRNVDWMVPDRCEYFHLPGLTSLVSAQAEARGKVAWLPMSRSEARTFRAGLISAIVAGFRPDVIVVEHFPLGLNDELADVLPNTACKKILLMSGLLTVHDQTRSNIFNDIGVAAMRRFYDKVMITTDPTIIDVGKRYHLPEDVCQRVVGVGYFSERISADTIHKVRSERGLTSGSIWVVCSAGGGGLGEPLLRECENLARARKDIFFDIIYGPMSEVKFPAEDRHQIDRGRVFVHRELRRLNLFHGSADVVVCSGGTNSLVESMEGGARIISCPVQPDLEDEQYVQAKALSNFYPVELLCDLSRLSRVLNQVIDATRTSPRKTIRERGRLIMNGVECAGQMIRTGALGENAPTA